MKKELKEHEDKYLHINKFWIGTIIYYIVITFFLFPTLKLLLIKGMKESTLEGLSFLVSFIILLGVSIMVPIIIKHEK